MFVRAVAVGQHTTAHTVLEKVDFLYSAYEFGLK